MTRNSSAGAYRCHRLSSIQRNCITTALALIFFVSVAYIHGFDSLPVLRPGLSPSLNKCNAILDTVIIVKTGANEIYDKLPTQVLTALRCHEDILFFSDLEQRLGPYSIHDALANVDDSVKSARDFDYYRTIQEYHKNGQDITTLRATTGDAAWNLDKYKFLHMLEESWELRPGRNWYVYIEADTYLIQSNLRLWLDRLDPSSPLYLGSPTSVNGEDFSHGGSGFVLSGTALSRFVQGNYLEGNHTRGRHLSTAASYDQDVQKEQFGDHIPTKTLRDKGVEFTPSWPMLQAKRPSEIPFGAGPDSGVRHWCQPVITMHHISPDEASQIWTFEQQRSNHTAPLLFKELYAMVSPQMLAARDDWYNLSDDLIYREPGVTGDREKPRDEMTPTEKDAYTSFEHCRQACAEQERCFQFAYTDQECGFSYSYRLGDKKLPKDGRSYRSGWILDKIASDQVSCSTAEWLPSS